MGMQVLRLVWRENNIGWNTAFMLHFSEYLWFLALLCEFSCQFKVQQVFWKKNLESPVETELLFFWSSDWISVLTNVVVILVKHWPIVHAQEAQC